jgi:hypothetical protein
VRGAETCLELSDGDVCFAHVIAGAFADCWLGSSFDACASTLLASSASFSLLALQITAGFNTAPDGIEIAADRLRRNAANSPTRLLTAAFAALASAAYVQADWTRCTSAGIVNIVVDVVEQRCCQNGAPTSEHEDESESDQLLTQACRALRSLTGEDEKGVCGEAGAVEVLVKVLQKALSYRANSSSAMGEVCRTLGYIIDRNFDNRARCLKAGGIRVIADVMPRIKHQDHVQHAQVLLDRLAYNSANKALCVGCCDKSDDASSCGLSSIPHESSSSCLVLLIPNISETFFALLLICKKS